MRLRFRFCCAAAVAIASLVPMTGPAYAVASPSASCVGQMVSDTAPVSVPFGQSVVTPLIEATDHQFGQTIPSVVSMLPRTSCP
jgi:hypothetical protein